MMDFEYYLKDELKRLNRMNDLLEKKTNKSETVNIPLNEIIIKNTLTMCEIAKVLR